jgi:predicted pyridoxine 5'-phosphate oxidase superfamily flavin-nucleotide-binding protein
MGAERRSRGVILEGAGPHRPVFFKVATWDANCPQHIPQRLEAEDVALAFAMRDRRDR